MKHVSLAIYDYSRNKLCDIYDSATEAKGQAYDVTQTSELSGWKELSFTLPFMIDREKNWRWNYVRNEYRLRLIVDQQEDWFIVQAPKKTKNGRAITDVVKCPHESVTQKTKNIYFVFDDENGIDTIGNLVEKVLANTGWTLGLCDTFYESDGVTEKIRSIASEGKAGAYKQITDICNQFNGYPVYHGDTKTVDIHALSNKQGLAEMYVGKNLETISVDNNSESIVTRLYVEGEYGDFGYVGIDDVNPTGLSYLQNFDYYKSIGAFTDEHQAAQDSYQEDMPSIQSHIMAQASQIASIEDQLNNLIGQARYVFYTIDNGIIQKTILRGGATSAQAELNEGDELTVLKADGPYRIVTVGESGAVEFENDDLYAFKFITKPSALIGSKEVAIEAKEKMIESLEKKIEQTTDVAKRQEYMAQIANYQSEIQTIYLGTEDADGLYDQMHEVARLLVELDNLSASQAELSAEQIAIEAEFSAAMGDLLRDGYWSDANYTVGQEQCLYNDAVELLEQISKPTITYTVSTIKQSEAMGREIEPFDLNSMVRLYDEDQQINDIVYVSKRVYYFDNPSKDTVEISNQDITLTGQGFDSVLSRITQLADLVNQKNALYSRAKAINGNGSIAIDRLNGTIDILKNRLLSASSSWYTDTDGNIVFESVTGNSAMMLTGEGFMIASGKNDDGSWEWRTFGTGEGFTADAIITGYLSADRIEAGSITVNKLASDVGQSLDLSSNQSINLKVEQIYGDMDDLIGYRIEIISTSDQLSESIKTTTLTARVWHGSENVTDRLAASRFQWKRVSSDSTADALWNSSHQGIKSITLTTRDVLYSATYDCELLDA